MHTHAQALAARAFILLADRKCFAQLNSAKPGTMTAGLLINKVKCQKENFSLITQLREKQYSHKSSSYTFEMEPDALETDLCPVSV